MKLLKQLAAFLGILTLLPTISPIPLSADPFIVETSKEGIQRAEIIVDTYSYAPSHLVVIANRPVELALRSVAWIVPHNFILKIPESGIDINKEVPAGQTITISFIPTREGRYKFICDKKLLFFKSHQEKGMEGILEVREPG